MSILVVAGEPSGDAAAARVIERSRERTFGMGGVAMAAAGADLILRSDRTAALGFTEVLTKLPRLVAARRRLLSAATQRGTKNALLVNYSEFNTSLLAPLAEARVRTVFYGPPQVWAWRPERAKKIAAHVGHIAAILPMEIAVWRGAGAKVSYVGHPALDTPASSREDALRALGAQAPIPVAILPGSRTAEVTAHLGTMLSALRTVGLRGTDARIFVSSALPAETQRWIATAAEPFDVPCILVHSTAPLLSRLAAFDVALVASGTAALEVALAGVVPIVTYRTSALTAAIARRLLRIANVGLPNIVLGRKAFPELLQEQFTSDALARALTNELGQVGANHHHTAIAELRDALAVKNRPCESVAELMSAQ